ncbi:MAG: hypothetical protein HYX69_16085 [Planctomycetia bacterium]|nr:hypothetical protein [Planctomycetia bacterium]
METTKTIWAMAGAISPGAGRTLRAALGGVLLVAAGLKAYDLVSAPAAASPVGSRLLAAALVEGEALLGLWLLSGFARRGAWRAALVAFALFACVSLYRGLSGAESCGCFGGVRVSPWWTFVGDLAAVFALWWWWPRRDLADALVPAAEAPEVVRERHAWRMVPAALAAVSLNLTVVWAIAMLAPARLTDAGDIPADAKSVVLEPNGWVGKRLPLLTHTDIGSQLSVGQWTVLLYHHDCPKCQEVLANYESDEGLADLGRARQVALVEVPPFDDTLIADSGAPLGFARGLLSADKEWFVATPVVIDVDDGTVVRVSSEL